MQCYVTWGIHTISITLEVQLQTKDDLVLERKELNWVRFTQILLKIEKNCVNRVNHCFLLFRKTEVTCQTNILWGGYVACI